MLATRFIDDISLAFRYDASSHPLIPFRVIQTLIHFLPRTLQLEFTNGNVQKFLRSIIKVRNGRLVPSLAFSNYDSVSSSRSQAHPSLIPWGDAHSRSEKASALIQRYHAVIQCTSPSLALYWRSICFIWEEFTIETLNYPISFLIRCLGTVAFRTHNPFFLCLYGLIHDCMLCLGNRSFRPPFPLGLGPTHH